MSECPMLKCCGFFRKYQNSFDRACRGFVATYCRGRLQDRCERMKYSREHGTPPPDDMMPTGHMLPTTEQHAPPSRS